MKSLYRKMIFPMIALIIIVAIITGGVAIYSIRSSIAPDIKNLTMDIMQSKADQVDLWLASNVQLVEQMARALYDTDLSGRNAEEVMTLLRRYQDREGNPFESLGYITLEGEKFVTDDSRFFVNDREYYMRLQEEAADTVVSRVIRSKAHNAEDIVLIVTKVYHDQELRGYFSAALSVSYLQTILERANYHDFYAFMIDERDGAQIGNHTESGSEAVETLRMASQIESNPSWFLVMEVPLEFINRNINETVGIIAIVVILSAIFSIILIRALARDVVRPVEQLEKAMSLPAEGYLEETPPNTEILELNQLGERFNQMVRNTRDLLDKTREQERQKMEAESKSLYAQIKPHFLYNTLETIQAMAYNADDQAVVQVVGDLADYFRIGLSQDRQIVSVREELRHTESYLRILKLRYGDAFSYTITCDESLYTLSFLKFTLQPLVENAVYHGIKKLERAGEIAITVEERGDLLWMRVANSSMPIAEADLEAIRKRIEEDGFEPGEKGGYGLYNVNQRLKLQFGEKGGILMDYARGVFTASIYHPILRNSNDED